MAAKQKREAATKNAGKKKRQRIVLASSKSGSSGRKKPASKIARKPGHQKKSASSQSAASLTDSQLLRMPARDYMNDRQLECFRQRLLAMRAEAEARLDAAREHLMQQEAAADDVDRASLEEERWLELRLREREATLINKINRALLRIQKRTFGYCEVTGEPIGLPRLLARPTATVCIDVKRDDEYRELQFNH
jgi:DnaK suppressor protein